MNDGADRKSIILRPSKLATMMFFLALVFSASVTCAERLCFLPRKSAHTHADLFVDPNSKVCRAFERELNANCAGDIPMVEFRPRLAESEVIEPAWSELPLYLAGNVENESTFALLAKLAWSRAMTTYSVDREARAKRDVGTTLARVREAHSKGREPRLQQVSIDLEGRGHGEVIYRLYSGLVQNPKSIVDENSSSKFEPTLFLARAIELASERDRPKVSVHAAGHDIAGLSADVLLFDGDPYFLTWSSDKAVLIYAAYSQRDRPMSSAEKHDGHSHLIPMLRCMFDSRPTH